MITTFLKPVSLSGENAATSCLTGAYTVLNSGTFSSHDSPRCRIRRPITLVATAPVSRINPAVISTPRPGTSRPSTAIDNGPATPSMKRKNHTSVTTVINNGTVTTRPVRKLRRSQPIATSGECRVESSEHRLCTPNAAFSTPQEQPHHRYRRERKPVVRKHHQRVIRQVAHEEL